MSAHQVLVVTLATRHHLMWRQPTVLLRYPVVQPGRMIQSKGPQRQVIRPILAPTYGGMYHEFSRHRHYRSNSSLSFAILMLGPNSTEALGLAILFAGFGKCSRTKDTIVAVVMFDSHSGFFIEPFFKFSLGSYGLSSTQRYLVSNVDIFGGSITEQGAPVKHICVRLPSVPSW